MKEEDMPVIFSFDAEDTKMFKTEGMTIATKIIIQVKEIFIMYVIVFA